MVLIPFVHPFRMMIVGPSGAGKTVFITHILEERLIDVWPKEVFVFCGEAQQPEYEKWKSMLAPVVPKFIENIPDDDFYDSLDPSVPRLIIIDDMMDKASNSQTVSDLFTKGSHHRNASIILITQNLFPKGKSMRTTSLNAQYLVLMENNRDRSQISKLDSQMYPKQGQILTETYDKATGVPYGQLIVDTRQETPKPLRMRSIRGKETHVFLKRDVFRQLPLYKKAASTPHLEKSRGEK